MSKSPNVHYLVSPYHSLRRGQRQDVARLVHASVAHDFPERESAELDYFERQAQRVRQNLTRGIGGSLLARNQSFARETAILAVQDGELRAYVLVADNVSNDPGNRWPLRVTERQLKLRSAELVGKRYAWFGYMAMDQALHAQITEAPAQATLVDGIGILGLDTRLSRQPVSVWPWENEEAWLQVTESWGLHRRAADMKLVYPFGPEPDTEPVMQFHYLASAETDSPKTVEDVQRRIMAKPGAEAIVAAARVNLVTGQG